MERETHYRKNKASSTEISAILSLSIYNTMGALCYIYIYPSEQYGYILPRVEREPHNSDR